MSIHAISAKTSISTLLLGLVVLVAGVVTWVLVAFSTVPAAEVILESPSTAVIAPEALVESTDSFSPFAELLKPVYYPASKLTIESEDIEVALTRVGVVASGKLETPTDWMAGGYYVDGAKVGEPGNLIINGHYDDNLGRPSAFYKLKNVSLGDKVTVQDTEGREFVYLVTERFFVEIDAPDRLEIFESGGDSAEITLITCGGVWLPYKGSYDQRLVVKGKLVSSAESA